MNHSRGDRVLRYYKGKHLLTFSRGYAQTEQAITVARESHKGIVVGKGGQMIRRIRSESQEELAELLCREVHLFVRVKVREKWAEDPGHFREWGLRFDA